MLNENLNVTGKLRVAIWDEFGNIKEDFTTENLVVTSGLNWIAARMVDTNEPNQMSHMSIGDDNTAAALGQTALLSELGRVTLTGTEGTPSNNTVEYEATFSPGTGTGAIVEAGIFNASSAGTMLCRTVFDVVNKGASDTMTITWTITIS